MGCSEDLRLLDRDPEASEARVAVRPLGRGDSGRGLAVLRMSLCPGLQHEFKPWYERLWLDVRILLLTVMAGCHLNRFPTEVKKGVSD